MSIFTGSGVALVTPFKANGEVNYEKLEELIDFHCNNGTDCIVIVGTSGEASTLSHEEHIECIRFAVEKTRHRIPVVAGTGSNCTETAVYLTGEAKKAGVDGVLVVSPYYNKATQKGLVAHFGTIAKSAPDVPVILYNIPGRTGVNILPETAARLVRENKNIVAMKDATGNIPQTMATMRACDGNIDIYSGEDGLITPMMSVGGKGVISVLANVLPRETHEICSRFLEGDAKGSLELQMKYLTLVDLLFSEVNPIPAKAALNMMGMNVGPMRLPLTEMEPEHAEALRKEMVKLGMIK
ncbi:MAG: 4-hydroxy-tetrahydrodipicolinate synthase [Lachnospiraceae bacterium]|nr:4-hydroxy-tetrahydrodipicolinate synthase [Lachnospiraceae bacterium]